MSGFKLNLRQPPNVHYVHGYPGIATSVNRPQAAVKGLVELRLLQSQPGKVKWLRVELRKTEVLPGGTQIYTKSIGRSPVTLWQAKGDWEPISASQDFPFSIDIPLDTPPSAALENGSGIKYEIIASLCYRTKKGLFRRESFPIMSASDSILVDKHELHATWPVYLKPDIREVSAHGFKLRVERPWTGYGPGDQVVARATIESTSSNAALIRSYEFTLREFVTFRVDASASKGQKSPQPQLRARVITQQRLPVNVQLQPGLKHAVDLSCIVPLGHKTPTVFTGDHIQVVHSLKVAVLFDGGQDVVLEPIPCMMSNWTRNISADTVRRIGWAPWLSTDTEKPIIEPPSPRDSASVDSKQQSNTPVPPPSRASEKFNTAPAASSNGSHLTPHAEVNEFGEASSVRAATTTSKSAADDTTRLGHPTTRPVTLTLANADALSIDSRQTPNYLSAAEEKARLHKSQQENDIAAAPVSGGSAQSTRSNKPAWPTADDEKRKQEQEKTNYIEARRRALARQGPSAAPPPEAELVTLSSTPVAAASTPVPLSISPAPTSTSVSAPSTQSTWPSAEQEKQRMFTERQNRAKLIQARTHGEALAEQQQYAGSVKSHRSIESDPVHGVSPLRPAVNGSPQVPSATLPPPSAIQVDGLDPGAMLYQSAMQKIVDPVRQPSSSASVVAPSFPLQPRISNGGHHQAAVLVSPPAHSQWPNAQQEKENLRYMTARKAVEQRLANEAVSGNPAPYEALYSNPAGPVSGLSPASRPSSPSVAAPMARSVSTQSDDGLRRQLLDPRVAQERIRHNVGGGSPPPPPPRRQTPSLRSHPSSPANSHFPPTSAASLPSHSSHADPTTISAPPSFYIGGPLSADQEKAALRARYEQEEASSTRPWSPQPPPDQPRPGSLLMPQPSFPPSQAASVDPDSIPGSTPIPFQIPPPFSGVQPPGHYDEKAGLRAQYAPPPLSPIDPSPRTSPPPPAPPPQQQYITAAQEKALLRARAEAEEHRFTIAPEEASGSMSPTSTAPQYWNPHTNDTPPSYPRQSMAPSLAPSISQPWSDPPAVPPMPPMPPPPAPWNSSVTSRNTDSWAVPPPTAALPAPAPQPSDRSPSPMAASSHSGGGDDGPSLRRDPTIREGKKRATILDGDDIPPMPSSPPPLMPRPPVEYIRESQSYGGESAPTFVGSSSPSVFLDWTPPTSEPFDFAIPPARSQSPFDISFGSFGGTSPIAEHKPPIPPKMPL